MHVTIISGARNSAKTTTLIKLIEENKDSYLGFVCLSDKNKNSYYLNNILTNDNYLIMQNTEINCKEKLGQFYIIDNSFFTISKILLEQIKEHGDKVIALDEIGLLELKGSGYDDLLKQLVLLDKNLLLCVRDIFVDKVIQKYKLENVEIINV